jgi:hypothetical protein
MPPRWLPARAPLDLSHQSPPSPRPARYRPSAWHAAPLSGELFYSQCTGSSFRMPPVQLPPPGMLDGDTARDSRGDSCPVTPSKKTPTCDGCAE